MRERMIIRLFQWPVVVLLLTLLSYWFLGDLVPSRFASSAYLSALGEESVRVASSVLAIGLLVVVVSAMYQGFRLWNWSLGNGEICGHCGGMVTLKDGRYGPYTQCLACGVRQKC